MYSSHHIVLASDLRLRLTARRAQDVFFSTQLADSGSGKWLGGPQVLLQGTLNSNVTNVIVTMNACASWPIVHASGQRHEYSRVHRCLAYEPC